MKLIGLLCEEELKKMHRNVRKVLWGGHQNAGDSGIDVSCEYTGGVDENSFIPRNKVARIQVGAEKGIRVLHVLWKIWV